ncbi:MAG TPA: hormogonium polysaccharide biosynthesis glycosyltransferase HpsE, partial [Coleofasciculaceae cyanobacterium]
VIPTYNGEYRLPEVLEKLRSQLNPSGIQWEILIVDNHSSDGTAQVVQTFQANFPVAIRYCCESRQGVGYARQKAIEQTDCDLIGFLDDDNLPDANWVDAAYQFAQTHPAAGAFGSQIRGAFESSLPPNLQRILPYLAITERGLHPKRYAPQNNLLPPAAGLVVRRPVWLKYVPEEGILTSLKFKRSDGNHCSEDLEALGYIQRSPWEIWYNPNMKIAHKIPARRLERAYLLPFFRSIGLSRHVIRMLNVKPWKRPLMALAYLANDLRKIVTHYLKYHSQLQTDLAAACEMELLVSSLISPFYWWQKRRCEK